jgi:hypothetical protein
MKSTEYIKKYFQKSTLSTNSDKHEAVFGKILRAYEQTEQQTPASSRLNIRMKIMKSNITRFAAAAVFIVVITSLHQFRISLIGTSVAWSDETKRLEQKKPFTARAHRVFTEVGKKEPLYNCDVFRYFSPDYGWMEKQYIDGKLGMLAYWLFREKSLLIVLPQTKQCYCVVLNKETLSIMECISPADTEAITKLVGSERCIKLGSRKIDGFITNGFEVKDINVFSFVPRIFFNLENVNMQLWIDPNTSLPIEAEVDGLIEKGLLTGFKDLVGKEIVYDIKYDAKIDESIFEPNIPNDYTLIDPAKIAGRAELTMWGILPLSVAIVIFKHFKKSGLR